MKSINPDPEMFQQILSDIPKGVPVVMLNLLKFRDKALYPDGHSDISGRDAYALYSEKAFQHVLEVGGKLKGLGVVYGEIIGPADEKWDEAILVEYPSIEKFLEMIMNTSYQSCSEHRTAALEDSRLIAISGDI